MCQAADPVGSEDWDVGTHRCRGSIRSRKLSDPCTRAPRFRTLAERVRNLGARVQGSDSFRDLIEPRHR
ncbi:hypothetical protein MAHJHV60_45960 [Mycobacterium avium subsp. hominissuis]